MKAATAKWILPLLAAVTLSGCAPDGTKSMDFSVVYAILAGLALLLFIICFFSQVHGTWLRVLFGCVAVVNAGYFLLSVAGSLEMAIWANRLSYLGSVFLPMSMLMIVVKLCRVQIPRWLTPSLVAISILVFLLSASYPWLTVYYESLSLRMAGGMPVLDKVYGPLHILYLFYLLGYMAAMIAVAVYGTVRKKTESAAQSALTCVAVMINIGVWLTEQFVHFNFELLSLSYIISELFLLGLSLVSQEHSRLLAASRTGSEGTTPAIPDDPAFADQLRYFKAQLPTLTPTEQTVLQLYRAGKASGEIRQALDISENTLKYHNKNIYSKLGVSSRKQLLLLSAALDCEE